MPPLAFSDAPVRAGHDHDDPAGTTSGASPGSCVSVLPVQRKFCSKGIAPSNAGRLLVNAQHGDAMSSRRRCPEMIGCEWTGKST